MRPTLKRHSLARHPYSRRHSGWQDNPLTDQLTPVTTDLTSAPIPTVLPAVTSIISTILSPVAPTSDPVGNHSGRAHDRCRAGYGCPDDPTASSAS